MTTRLSNHIATAAVLVALLLAAPVAAQSWRQSPADIARDLESDRVRAGAELQAQEMQRRYDERARQARQFWADIELQERLDRMQRQIDEQQR